MPKCQEDRKFLGMHKTNNFGTVKYSPGWKRVKRETMIDFDFETTPLQIKTNSTAVSNDLLMVNLYDAQGSSSGYIAIKFKTSPEYKLGKCGGYTKLPDTLPLGKGRVWNITKTVNPFGIIVHCNDKAVLDVKLSDKVCTEYSGNWSLYWKNKVTQIEFSSNDTASDKYYQLPGKSVKYY